MNWEKLIQLGKINAIGNWEKLCPNLSFTVENKINNLHKIKLFTFQN